MRVSTQTIIVDLEDERTSLLMHGVLGTVDLVSRDLARMVASGKELGEIPNSGAMEAHVERLGKRGYLTHATPEEERAALERRMHQLEKYHARRDRVPKFVLVMSYQCNLRCVYCFQEPRRPSMGGAKMDVAHVRRCFRILNRYPRSGHRKTLELFGGEPLMSRNREAVSVAVAEASALGMEVMATTNGRDLAAFQDLLGPGRISEVLVTLDGPEAIHDPRRPTRDHEPTYQGLVANVKMALAHQTRVMARVNLDHANLAHLPELLRHLQVEGILGNPLFSVFYAPVKSVLGSRNPWPTLGSSEITDYLEANRRVHPELDSIHEKGGNLLSDLIQGRTLPMSRTRACGAVGASLYLAPDDRVYACHEVVGNPAFAIGTYDEALHIDPNAETRWRHRRLPGLPRCLDCAYVLLCAGGCAVRALARGEDIEPSCENFEPSFLAATRREFRLHNKNHLTSSQTAGE